MFNIGWVFYSEKQRENLETIISMTQEPGTLDELGLGSVRDGFANLFFPGTTTIQTRAKYFILVPWILNEIYRKNDDFTAFRAPYTYSWYGIPAWNTSGIPGLVSNIYTVKVTDANLSHGKRDFIRHLANNQYPGILRNVLDDFMNSNFGS